MPFSEPGRCAKSRGQVALCPLRGLRNGHSQCQIRGDRGRQRAAGSVRVHSSDKWRAQQQLRPAIVIDVYGILHSPEMAALNQGGTAKTIVQRVRSVAERSDIAHFREDFAAAEAYLREAIAVRRRGGSSQDSSLARDLARLARIQCARGDNSACERSLREAVAVARRAFPAPHRDHAFLLLRLAEALDDQPLDQGPAAHAEAESLYYAALSESRAVFGDSHPETAQAMKEVGLMLARHHRDAEGERLLRQVLELQRRALGPSHPEVASTMLSLGKLLRGAGYSAEAEQLTRDAVAIDSTVYGTSHPAYGWALSLLADVLTGLDRHEHQLHVLSRVQHPPEVAIRFGAVFDVVDVAFHVVFSTARWRALGRAIAETAPPRLYGY